MNLKETIKKSAKEKGLTISKLEVLAGIGTNTIKHWDHVKPSADKLYAVAKVLGVTMEYLLEPEAGREAV